MFDVVQVAVIDLWLYAKDVTHQRVDVYCLKWSNLQVFVKGRTYCPEERLHVHLLVVEAMLTVVELDGKILQEKK